MADLNFNVPIDFEQYSLSSEDLMGRDERDDLHQFWLKKKQATENLGIDCYSPFTISHKAFLESQAHERVFLGGNSSAKTWTAAALVTALAIGKHPTIKMKTPNEWWVACEDFALNKEGPVKALLTLGGQYISEYSEHYKIIRYKNRSQVQLKSYESGWKKFQAAAKDGVWFDEEPPEEIYKEGRMRTMRTSGYIITSMTPLEGMTWMYDMLFLDKDFDGNIFFASLYDNFTLKEEDIKRTISRYSPEDRQARVYGKFTQMAGLVYPMFKRGLHTIRPFKLDPNDYVIFKGIDPHITTETAIVWLAIKKTGEQYVVNELFTGGTIPQIARRINQTDAENKYRCGWNAMDAAAKADMKIYDRDIHSDFGKEGINCLLAPKGPGSIGKGISDTKEKLLINKITGKPTLRVFENCPLSIKAFQTLTRETYRDESKRGKKDKIAEGRHHTHAALRYIYQLSPRYFDPIDEKMIEDIGPYDEVIGY